MGHRYGSTEQGTAVYGSAEEPDVMLTERQSIPVHVASSDAKPGKPLAAEFGRWRTIIVSNVVGPYSITPGAVRLLNRSLRRKRAQIIVNATIAAQAVTDGVIVGSREEICSGNAGVIGSLGGFLDLGTSIRYEAQAELWVCYPVSNANSVLVTICDEVYASDPDSYFENENQQR
jgi:hypothetical protein